MNKKKVMLILMITILSFSLFAGCGKQLTSQTSGKKSDNQKVTIRFATWDFDETLKLQQKLVDKFNNNNKNIKVILEEYGSNYDTKIAAGIGAKDAPDVMYMKHYGIIILWMKKY